MKKLLGVLLIMIMMTSAFAGCGNTNNTPTTEGTTMAQQGNYKSDSTLRILMVGNSFCSYYMEELYELLMENPPEGINSVEIYRVYYSGCTLSQHYLWWQQNAAKYDFTRVTANGREKMTEHEAWSLEQTLAWADWDYISLQGTVSNGSYINELKREPTRAEIEATAGPLLDRFHELHPNAQLLWHRTWFFEVGRVGSDGYVYKEEDGPKYDAGMQEICDYMCNEFDKNKPYDLKIVNSGAAWTQARKLNETANLLPYGGLCARLDINRFGDMRMNSGDGYHDGDIGGGQLLNAYMWYMAITGNTDLTASKYVPVYKYVTLEYPMSTELVDMLKTAAMNAIK